MKLDLQKPALLREETETTTPSMHKKPMGFFVARRTQWMLGVGVEG
jgi:hypothetical protein